MFGQLASGAGMIRVGPVFLEDYTTLNSANARAATSFYAATASIEGYSVYFAGVVGSGVSVEVALHAATASGVPTGAALATDSFSPTSDTWHSQTFSSPVSVTQGAMYALVVRNTSATPASNYPRPMRGDCTRPNCPPGYTSADGGSTWSVGVYVKSFALYPRYNDGLRCPYWASRYASSSVTVYDDRAVAIYLRSPIKLRLHGIVANMQEYYGSPAGNIVGTVRSAANAVLSNSTNAHAATASGADYIWQWATPYELAADTDYYVGIGTENLTEGEALKFWRFNVGSQIAAAAPNVGLVKGMKHWNGSAWVDAGWMNLTAYVEAPLVGGVKIVDFAGGYGG